MHSALRRVASGITRRLVLAGMVGAAAMAAAGPASAQDAYPSRKVTIVVPYGPGGAIDILAREIAQRLSAKFGQPVIVENRAGAGGAIGTEAVARSPADGYTILIHSTAIVTDQFFRKAPTYYVEKDLTPIAIAVESPLGLYVSGSSPYQTLKDLLDDAKKNPEKLRYSTSGVAGLGHLSMELFASTAGVKLTHLPFKSGQEATVAVLTGEAHMTLNTLAFVKGMQDAQKLRLLGVGTASRVPGQPDAPTIAEAGVAGYQANNWTGIFAPAATPKAIVEKLNAEISAVMASPDLAKKIADQGDLVRPMSIAQLQVFITQQLAVAEKVIASLNMEKQ